MLILLVLLLAVASLPAGSVVLASALAPVAVVGGLALEYGLVDPRIVPAFGLLAVPGLILGLRTARKYPKQHLRHRLTIAVILLTAYLSVDLTLYAFKGNIGATMGDPSRHASYALTLLTAGEPPVFYDTLRQEYRPVHYPSGLGHIAITESIVSCLYHPKDVQEAASWQVQFGSVFLELLEHHLDAALITSSIVDLLLIARGRLPIYIIPPLAYITYLTCTAQYAEFIPFFQSLAMLAASAVALILNSRLLSGLLALGAIAIHAYGVIIVTTLILALLWAKKTRITTVTPILLGTIIGAIMQYPYVHWSVMTYFPRYPAHPNHLPPDRILSPVACLLQFFFTAFAAYPMILFPTTNSLPYVLPFTVINVLIIIKVRKLLPSVLRVMWITCIVTILALAVVSGSIVGGRLLVVVPLLTAMSLVLPAANRNLLALGALFGYCALTIHWWLAIIIHGNEGISTLPVWVLKEHWNIFYKSLCNKDVIATLPEGLLPFTCTWKPREVAYVVRTFPEPYTSILLTAKEGSEILLYAPPVRAERGYIVKKLPPPGRVWVAGNRAGSLRCNVLIGAERYNRQVIIHVNVVNYSWVPIPTINIKGKLRKRAIVLSTPKSSTLPAINVHRIPEGFLVRISYSHGVRVVKITISGARWVGDKLVFHGSLRDLIANIRVTGDLV
ncbi:TPA: hypothetical protein HA336_05035 [Methanopyrus kandleri]|nr:hypothetical protein [Methanopyrus kandleri]